MPVDVNETMVIAIVFLGNVNLRNVDDKHAAIMLRGKLDSLFFAFGS